MGASEDYLSCANGLQRNCEVYVNAAGLRLVPPGLIDSLGINEHRVNKHWGKTLPHFFRGVLDSTPIQSYIAGMKTNQLDDVVPSISFRHFLQGELATLTIPRFNGATSMKPGSSCELKDGGFCKVIGGVHAGKSGVVRDIKTGKTGYISITVVQANGVRFKTLAKNVEIETETA